MESLERTMERSRVCCAQICCWSGDLEGRLSPRAVTASAVDPQFGRWGQWRRAQQWETGCVGEFAENLGRLLRLSV